MHRLRRLVPLALLLVLAAGLAACGGGADLASDPAKVLADAQPPAAGPSSVTLKATMAAQTGGASTSADGGGALGGLLSGPISIDASIDGDPATALTADATIAAGPLTIPVSARSNADDAWLQVGGQWYALGQPLGLDAASLAEPLAAAAKQMADPKATAVEDIGGVTCDRITGTLKPGADLAGQLGGLLGQLPVDTKALTSGKAQMSVWVGRDDHRVRRVQIDTGDGGLLVDLTVVPSAAVTVEAPADAKPISALLSGALGKAVGGTGLGGLGKALQGGQLDLGKLLGGGDGGLGGLLGGGATTG